MRNILSFSRFVSVESVRDRERERLAKDTLELCISRDRILNAGVEINVVQKSNYFR